MLGQLFGILSEGPLSQFRPSALTDHQYVMMLLAQMFLIPSPNYVFILFIQFLKIDRLKIKITTATIFISYFTTLMG